MTYGSGYMLIQFPDYLFDKVSDILNLFREYGILDGHNVEGHYTGRFKDLHCLRIWSISERTAVFLGNVLRRVHVNGKVASYCWVEHFEDDE